MEQKRIANMQLNHLGIILSNLSIFGMALMLLVVSAVLIYGFLVLLAIIPVLFTLGLIVIGRPDYFDWLSDTSFLARFVDTAFSYLPLLAWVTLGLSVASIVCLSFYKGQKSWWRVVLCSILVVASVLIVAGVIGG